MYLGTLNPYFQVWTSDGALLIEEFEIESCLQEYLPTMIHNTVKRINPYTKHLREHSRRFYFSERLIVLGDFFDGTIEDWIIQSSDPAKRTDIQKMLLLLEHSIVKKNKILYWSHKDQYTVAGIAGVDVELIDESVSLENPLFSENISVLIKGRLPISHPFIRVKDLSKIIFTCDTVKRSDKLIFGLDTIVPSVVIFPFLKTQFAPIVFRFDSRYIDQGDLETPDVAPVDEGDAEENLVFVIDECDVEENQVVLIDASEEELNDVVILDEGADEYDEVATVDESDLEFIDS